MTAVAVPDFLAVAGPTCAGKTRLSLRVAEALDGEIVSVDSRQVYRGMDVGTAKATPEERARIPHHGLDVRDPDQRYGAGEFVRDARRWIAGIAQRGRVPVLAGGTGFYLKALAEPLFEEPALDPGRRRALERFLAALSRADLERWVRALDPSRAETAAAGGRQRLLRTASMALLTGRPLSWWHRRRPGRRALQGVACVIRVPPEVLAERIDRRVRAMVADGLLEETARLLEAGYRREDPGMSGVGYREMVDHVEGRLSLAQAVERAQAATRRYARRQRTWFRGQLGPGATMVDGAAPIERQVEAVLEAWRSATAGASARREVSAA